MLTSQLTAGDLNSSYKRLCKQAAYLPNEFFHPSCIYKQICVEFELLVSTSFATREDTINKTKYWLVG